MTPRQAGRGHVGTEVDPVAVALAPQLHQRDVVAVATVGGRAT